MNGRGWVQSRCSIGNSGCEVSPENTDGQVFLRRIGNRYDDEDLLELTFHEWRQFRDDVKAGKFDDV